MDQRLDCCAAYVASALHDDVCSALGGSLVAPWAWLISPQRILIPVSSSALPPGLILGADGRVIQSPAPAASDRRIFLSPTGGWIAAAAQPAGSRPLALVNGVLRAT